MTTPQTRTGAATPWSTWMFTTVAGIAFGVVVATALEYRHVFGTVISTSSSEWNNFGTFFGGLLGPILSMLAFFALVYTIFLQEQQLSLARATLKAADEDKELTRKQLDAAVGTQAATVEALDRQLKTSREQSAIATFFEMVRLHHEIVNGVAYGNTSGRASLQILFAGLRSKYTQTARAGHMTQIDFDNFVANLFNADQGVTIAHYFRNLYRIYKYVDESTEIPDKLSLTGIIRAQLTPSELGLVFYNGVSNEGQKFKPLLEKYAVFENFNKNALFALESRNDYKDEAWGENLNTL